MTHRAPAAPAGAETLLDSSWWPARDVGIDLARGLAVVAMIIAHVRVWAGFESLPVVAVLTQINNVASPLFCLVMGVAAGIVLTRRDRQVRGQAFVLRNLLRGVVMITLGLLLEQLPTFVAIVLQSLGVTLIVGSVIALLPVVWIAAVAVLTFVLGPVVNAFARANLPPFTYQPDGVMDHLWAWTVLSPHYRLTGLLPFFLVGVLVARRGLRTADLRLMVAAGAVALLVTAARLVSRGIEPATIWDNISDLGLSFTAFGLIMLLCRSGAVRERLRPAEPVLAVGAMGLTSYSLHVVLIAGFVWAAMRDPDLSLPWMVPAATVMLVTVIGCWIWWRTVGRGPIEWLLGQATDPIR